MDTPRSGPPVRVLLVEDDPVHRLIAEKNYVVAQTSGFAETLDGRPYNNSYVWIIRIEDGRFAEVTEYMDTELINSTFGPSKAK